MTSQPPRREQLRVAVHAAYPAVRAGIAALLRDAGCDVVEEVDAEAGSLDPAPPAVVVVDLGGATEDTAPDDETPTVFLAEPGTHPLPHRGAYAWLPRDIEGDALAAAVRAVARGLVVLDPALARRDATPTSATDVGEGDPTITAREREVLALLAAGLTNKAIARALAISEHTVKFHVGALLAKLDARSRTEAVTAAARRGLLSL